MASYFCSGKEAQMTEHWVYILLCNNDNYYTGYTTDLMRRYEEHLNGSAKCKYTRSFKPLKIAQAWKILDGKQSALCIERYIKKLSKQEKSDLILFPEKLKHQFPASFHVEVES
jgi:putative endonuclease